MSTENDFQSMNPNPKHHRYTHTVPYPYYPYYHSPPQNININCGNNELQSEITKLNQLVNGYEQQLSFVTDTVGMLNKQVNLLEKQVSVLNKRLTLANRVTLANRKLLHKKPQHKNNDCDFTPPRKIIPKINIDIIPVTRDSQTDQSMVIQMDKNVKDSKNMFGSIMTLIEAIEKKKAEDTSNDNPKNESDSEQSVEYDEDIEYHELDIEINTIDDLIKLGEEYGKQVVDEKPIEKEPEKPNLLRGVILKNGKIKFIDDSNVPTSNDSPVVPESKNTNGYIHNNKRYSINLETLYKLIKPLKKLQTMVGLGVLKNSIVEMVMYFLQEFENKNNNMLHTVIEGPPGVGKTEVGKILAEIYVSLGIIKSNKFKLVKRSDLIGEYLGHTAVKTQKVIDEANGGVLFIDEAYSLGNEEKRDSFSKECIDTINLNLSENKSKFICIIAGYPDELDKCFFAYNPGLERRFPFRLKIDGYKADELRDIFIKKVTDIKWELTDEINMSNLNQFFVKHLNEFQYYGGDIETLLVMCKFAHSKRVFGKHPINRKKINMNDLQVGFQRFVDNKKKNTAKYSGNMYS